MQSTPPQPEASHCLAAQPHTHGHSMETRLKRGMVILRRSHRRGLPVNLSDFFSEFGTQSFALAIGVLALPFMSPLSLGPLTTPASLLIIFLSWQFLRGHQRPALPARFMRAPYPEQAHRVLSWMMMRILHFKRWVTRPRMSHIVEGRRGRVISACGMLVGGVLLMVPIPMLPFTNTFPALAVALFAFGWFERDGLLTIAGAISNTIGFSILAAIGILGVETVVLVWKNLVAQLA